MCLGIPGLVTEILDADKFVANVEVSGVTRKINVACVAEADKLDDLVGKWVLLHVGFAMSIIDEEEAARTLEVLTQMGELQEEMAAMRNGAVA
jgi:hydrogenase expression/formation protein HypC